MPGIEGIKASRPLEQEPWLGEFQEAAPGLVGEDALNFDDRALGTQELEILGAKKFIALRGILPEAENVDGDELADIAEERRPETLHIPISLLTTGELGVTYMSDQNEAHRRVLVADIHQTRVIVHEQKVLEEVVDEALEARPSRRPTLRAKIAAVNKGHYISEKDLEQLAYLLPERMRAHAGEIIPIDIGPGSVRDQRAEMEEFARSVSLDAAHDMAKSAVLPQA